MKIGIVTPSFYPSANQGGAAMAAYEEAKSLAEAGFEVFVFTTNSDKFCYLNVPVNLFTKLQKNLNVKYYHDTILDRFSLPLFLNLYSDIKAMDVIHIHAIFNTPVPLALYLSKKLNKPIFISPHGVLGEWILNHGIRMKKLWLKILIKPFANTITWIPTSFQEKEEIIDQFPSAKTVTIPFGIDTKLYAAAPSISSVEFMKKFAGKKVRQVDHIIISMGRIHRKKGFDILIQAHAALVRKRPASYLLIAGDDDGHLAELKEMVSFYKLQDKVFFTGGLYGYDKLIFLRNADIFVLPSHNENLGLVYLEALAAGTPVVASKATPWQDIELYGCGKWVENQVPAVVSAIDTILHANRHMIEKNCQLFAQRFDWKNITSQYANSFLEINTNKTDSKLY